MGLMSALEQSYLVRYPRRPSSTFALPSTRKKPDLHKVVSAVGSVEVTAVTVP